MVADRLWLVENGHVSVFNSDMTDYKKRLLAKRSESCAITKNQEKKPTDKQLSTGRQRRQSTNAAIENTRL